MCLVGSAYIMQGVEVPFKLDTQIFLFCFVLFCFAVLGIQPRASCKPGKHYIAE